MSALILFWSRDFIADFAQSSGFGKIAFLNQSGPRFSSAHIGVWTKCGVNKWKFIPVVSYGYLFWKVYIDTSLIIIDIAIFTLKALVKCITKDFVAPYSGRVANGAIPAAEPIIIQRPSLFDSIRDKIILSIIAGTIAFRLDIRHNSLSGCLW